MLTTILYSLTKNTAMMPLMPPQAPDKQNYKCINPFVMEHIYLLCMHIHDINYIYVHTILKIWKYFKYNKVTIIVCALYKDSTKIDCWYASRFVLMGLSKTHGWKGKEQRVCF